MILSATRAGVAALVLVWGGVGISVAVASDLASIDAGFVAVAEVPPAALPGAKVRTTGRIELLLARDLADKFDAELLDAASPAQAAQRHGGAGVWLGAESQTRGSVPAGSVHHSLNYLVGPMAIMRSDTSIHDWSALATRTVCVVENEPYVGELAARFGAIEQRYPSATDALLAVRAGQCDAGVMSDRLLTALEWFPEWKKFSARLPAYRHEDLVWASTRSDAEVLWNPRMRAITPAELAALTAQQARDIAFEVYLDQVVPDCH